MKSPPRGPHSLLILVSLLFIALLVVVVGFMLGALLVASAAVWGGAETALFLLAVAAAIGLFRVIRRKMEAPRVPAPRKAAAPKAPLLANWPILILLGIGAIIAVAREIIEGIL